jgi:hypothetical protein
MPIVSREIRNKISTLDIRIQYMCLQTLGRILEDLPTLSTLNMHILDGSLTEVQALWASIPLAT